MLLRSAAAATVRVVWATQRVGSSRNPRERELDSQALIFDNKTVLKKVNRDDWRRD